MKHHDPLNKNPLIRHICNFLGSYVALAGYPLDSPDFLAAFAIAAEASVLCALGSRNTASCNTKMERMGCFSICSLKKKTMCCLWRLFLTVKSGTWLLKVLQEVYPIAMWVLQKTTGDTEHIFLSSQACLFFLNKMV